MGRIPRYPRQKRLELEETYKRPRSQAEASGHAIEAHRIGGEIQELRGGLIDVERESLAKAHASQIDIWAAQERLIDLRQEAAMYTFGMQKKQHRLRVAGFIAEQIEKVAMIFVGAKAEQEFASAQVAVNKGLQEFELSLVDIPIDQYNDRFTETRVRIYNEVSEGIKTRRARRAFDNWFESEMDNYSFELGIKTMKHDRAQMRAAMLYDYEYWRRQRNYIKMEAVVESAVAKGIFEPVEGEKLLQEGRDSIRYNNVRRAAFSIIKTEGFDAAIKFVEGDQIPKEFTKEQRDTLEKEIRTEWGLAVATEKERHNVARNKQRILGWEMYSNNELNTTNLFDKKIFGDLEGSDIGQFINVLEEKARRALKDEEFKLKTDPILEAEWSKLLTDPTVSRDEKFKWLRENFWDPETNNEFFIGPDELLKWSKDLDVREPSYAKMAGIAIFDEMLEGQEITESEYAKLINYFEISTAAELMKTGVKELTADQYITIANNIANPEKRKLIARWLDRLPFVQAGESQEEFLMRVEEEGRAFGARDIYATKEKWEEIETLKKPEDFIFNKVTGSYPTETRKTTEGDTVYSDGEGGFYRLRETSGGIFYVDEIIQDKTDPTKYEIKIGEIKYKYVKKRNQKYDIEYFDPNKNKWRKLK